MKALVTGATGFIGRRLLARLPGAVVLTRDPEHARRSLPHGVTPIRWDPVQTLPPAEAFQGVDVVFNLAGEPVAQRWTDERKVRMRESRVTGTRNLVEGMRGLQSRPKALVSASAVGYYGNRGNETLDESSPPGSDFLADLCRAWEAETARAAEIGVRPVCLRFGIVLGRDGGALAKMLPPFRLGLGGRLGSGEQWMPWIHVDDVVGIAMHAAEKNDLSGPVNAVGPAPATNAEFTRTLGDVLHRPAIFPVPAPALRIVAGEMSAVLLSSQRVFPRVAERSGYTFRHPTLEGALRTALTG
jgi:uncharacterized protein (TIGR01777 family)